MNETLSDVEFDERNTYFNCEYDFMEMKDKLPMKPNW